MFEGSRSPASHAVNLRRRTHCHFRPSLRRGAATVLAAAAVLALAAAAFYVVYQAPMLMAEVALDGALVGSLYHRLRECERQHWLHAMRDGSGCAWISACSTSPSSPSIS